MTMMTFYHSVQGGCGDDGCDDDNDDLLSCCPGRLWWWQWWLIMNHVIQGDCGEDGCDDDDCDLLSCCPGHTLQQRPGSKSGSGQVGCKHQCHRHCHRHCHQHCHRHCHVAITTILIIETTMVIISSPWDTRSWCSCSGPCPLFAASCGSEINLVNEEHIYRGWSDCFQEADMNKLIWLRIYENPLGPSSTTIELSRSRYRLTYLVKNKTLLDLAVQLLNCPPPESSQCLRHIFLLHSMRSWRSSSSWSPCMCVMSHFSVWQRPSWHWPPLPSQCHLVF